MRAGSSDSLETPCEPHLSPRSCIQAHAADVVPAKLPYQPASLHPSLSPIACALAASLGEVCALREHEAAGEQTSGGWSRSDPSRQATSVLAGGGGPQEHLGGEKAPLCVAPDPSACHGKIGLGFWCMGAPRHSSFDRCIDCGLR
jgi:hypothetical protein